MHGGTLRPTACLPCKLALHGGCEPRLRCPLLMLLAPHRLSAAGGDAAPKAGRQAGGQGVGAGHARAGGRRRGRGGTAEGRRMEHKFVSMTSSLMCMCLAAPTNQETDQLLASPLALFSRSRWCCGSATSSPALTLRRTMSCRRRQRSKTAETIMSTRWGMLRSWKVKDGEKAA